MIYLNDHIGALDVEQALAAVSPQRRAYALKYRRETDRRLSLAVYLLLAEGLEREYGITGPLEFGFGYHGKPFLAARPDIQFNLSHCARAALCVIGGEPVGCDIETVPDGLDMDLCRRCFSEGEIDTILASARPTEAFTELWTRKEAFLKLTGEGLTDHLPALLCSPEAEKVSFHTFSAPDHSYVYTVCDYRPAAIL